MTLKELFTNIANSIRSKDGTSEPINATDFPSRIESIPSATTHFGDDFPMLDGNTHFWLKRELEEQYDTYVLKFYLVDGEITFNWGDGTSDTINTVGYQEISHVYDVGEYRLDIVATGTWRIGNAGTVATPEVLSRALYQYIEIGSGVESVGVQSLQTFYRLKEIALNVGDGNTCRLFNNALSNGFSLQKCTVYSGIYTQYSTQAGIFQNCYSLLEADLSHFNFKNIQGFFYQCYALVKVTGLEGVTTIGNNTFLSCANLRKIILPSSITEISATGFASCTRLTDIYVPWGEDEVANSPWGAVNAQIHFNYTEESEV